MSKPLRAMIFMPLLPPMVRTIKSDLRTMQKLVDGYIEVIEIGRGLVAVCNDEGKVNNMMPNRPIRDWEGKLVDVFCGPFFVVRDGEDGEFASMTDEDLAWAADKFAQMVLPVPAR